MFLAEVSALGDLAVAQVTPRYFAPRGCERPHLKGLEGSDSGVDNAVT